jgi:hypothetical protein
MSYTSPGDSSAPNIEELEREMHALLKLQNDGLQNATFLGMTRDEAEVIWERRKRITALVDRIAKLKASE